MHRLFLLCAIFLCLLQPAAAQNQTGYPLPDSLQTITPENVSQLQPLASIGGDLPGDLAWSPDGKTLAVGTTGGVRAYSSANWQAEPKQLPGWKDVRFDAAGNLVSDGKVVNLETGAIVSYTANETPSRKTAFQFSEVDGKAAVSLIDNATGNQTILNTELVGTINQVVFSPDEQFVAVEMSAQDISENGYKDILPAGQLWDITAGILVATLDIPGYDVPMQVFTFSAQGKLLVFASEFDGEDGSQINVAIWDGQTGTLLNTPYDDYLPINFNPDKTLMAFPKGDGLALWSDHEIGILRGDYYWQSEFSPNGYLLAGYQLYSPNIAIWTIENAKKLRPPDKVLNGKYVKDVVFSPDGSLLAAYETNDNSNDQLRIWNLETGETETIIANIREPIQFSQNSQWILAKQASNPLFALWDARTGEQLMTFKQPFAIDPAWTYAAQWSGPMAVNIANIPDGKSVTYIRPIGNYLGETQLLDANAGRVLFSAQAFDTQTGNNLFIRTSSDEIPSDYALNADWTRILTVGSRDAYYNTTQQPLAVVQNVRADAAGYFQSFAGDAVTASQTVFLTPNGKSIGSISIHENANSQTRSRLEFRDVETGEHLAEWIIPGKVEAMAISHDYKTLVLVTNQCCSSSLIFLDLNGDLKDVIPQFKSVNYTVDGSGIVFSSLVFSPDDSHLAITGYSGFCGDGGCDYYYFTKVWDVNFLRYTTLGEQFSMVISDVNTPIFSQRGNLLLVTDGNNFNGILWSGVSALWAIGGGKPLVEFDRVTTAAFSPDTHLLVAHQNDNTVLYDVSALRKGDTTPLTTIPDLDKPVKELAFSPDGKILYVMSENRLWLYGVKG